MIQKYLKAKTVFAALCLTSATACLETSQLEEVVQPVPVEKTLGFPRRAIPLDTALNLRVLYRPENGCGRFSRVDTVVTPLNTQMQVFVAYPLEDQEAICADRSQPVAFSFRFRPTQSGKHYFRFWQADGKFLLDSVLVR